VLGVLAVATVALPAQADWDRGHGRGHGYHRPDRHHGWREPRWHHRPYYGPRAYWAPPPPRYYAPPPPAYYGPPGGTLHFGFSAPLR